MWLKAQGPSTTRSGRPLTTLRALGETGYVDELEFVRRMRNQLVHGTEIPPAVDLETAAYRLTAIVAEISRRAGLDASEAHPLWHGHGARRQVVRADSS